MNWSPRNNGLIAPGKANSAATTATVSPAAYRNLFSENSRNDRAVHELHMAEIPGIT